MARRSKKGFEYCDGIYYFTINTRAGIGNITMHRKSKSAAVRTFRRYEGIGKDVVWHGKWDGKNFVEASITSF